MQVSMRSFARGETIHCAGYRGNAWRVMTGAVRLDRRSGDALARVRRLILMLAGGRGDAFAIPLAKDMAEITDLTPETVSRAFSVLRRQGLLEKHGSRFGLVHRDELQVA